MKPRRMSAAEFDELFKEVCNRGRWGPDDELGTLNFITPATIRAVQDSIELAVKSKPKDTCLSKAEQSHSFRK